MGRLRTSRLYGAICLLVLVALLAGPAHAQQTEVPRNEDAALMFEQGLAAFEAGDYGAAYERFRLATEYDLNRNTTAALLMAGKALYRLERYREAIDVLNTLLDRYPGTSYRDAAQAVLDAAERGQAAYGQAPDTLRVGVVLPMRDQDTPLTQALFNGIRLAVDAHNGVRRRYVLPSRLRASVDTFNVYDTNTLFSDSLAQADGPTSIVTPQDTIQTDSLQIVTEQVRRPSWVAQMVFRRTEATPASARAAVDSLVRHDDADVIIGPLYSREARTAGARAEQARTVLVAPLATDVSVSAGRQHVFQANPTIPMRGRLMARFAAQSLLIDQVGVVFEANDDAAARMATGFREEASRIGLGVPFTLELSSAREWSRLPLAFEADSTLTPEQRAAAEAVYLPVTGRNAQGDIQDALVGLRRMSPDLRGLGNSQWHDVSFKKEASRHLATYANDFDVQTRRVAVQRFIRNYRLLTGRTPGELSATGKRLAYTGYDVAHFLLSTLSPAARPTPAALRRPDAYDGLGIRIDFRAGNVNEAMFFHRYRAGRIERLR
jgi:ABC-type branched-subunit amino acid transport system substrate-binding protein